MMYVIYHIRICHMYALSLVRVYSVDYTEGG